MFIMSEDLYKDPNFLPWVGSPDPYIVNVTVVAFPKKGCVLDLHLNSPLALVSFTENTIKSCAVKQ
jgi:hypothetical protein